MVDVNKLKEEELENLEKKEEEVIYDLESLILDGVDSKVPIVIDFPTSEGVKKVGALIKPLTAVEWNNAIRLANKLKDSTSEIEIVKIGLFSKDGEAFSYDLIMKMPSGVVKDIFYKIADVSGVKFSEQEIGILEAMMGF